MINWFQYGVDMAQAAVKGTDTYAATGIQYIAESEGIVGTPDEVEFLKGWDTIIPLKGYSLPLI